MRRLWWGALGLGASSVIAVARALTPDPSGFGTHEQLGLPPCAFFAWTQQPCPACGLTTSFAHMAQSDLTSAALSHALGVPLFLIVLFAVPICAWACVRAWPIVGTIDRFQVQRVALVFAVASIVVWLVRLAVRMSHVA